jgi:hypothetical protein
VKRIEIRLRIINGCLSADQALANIHRAAEELGLQDRVVVWIRAVWSQGEADETGLPGSPTIMIRWKDMDPDNAGEPCYGSRLYMQDGRFTSVPSVEMIKEALAKAAEE